MGPPSAVTLTVVHPSLAADDVSRLLCLEPGVKHTAGEQRRSCFGELLDETYEHTFWVHAFRSETKGTAALANEVVTELGRRESGVAVIARTGGKVTLTVGLHPEEDRSSLERELTPSAEALGLELQIEHWTHPGAQG
jgi:hypothetical protein